MAEINIHATCIAIGARGVLLLGPPGAGKSDVALRLIDGGAKLVADDRTIIFIKGNGLHARAPTTIHGLLEIRGVGIVGLPAHRHIRLVLAVRLGREGARLPKPTFWRVSGIAPKLPQIALDPHFASTPAKIRMAVAALASGRLQDWA